MDAHFIPDKIVVLRGTRVIIDSSLADLYDVEARVLNQAVKRNLERFPADFMFQVTELELREITNSSQIVMSSFRHRGRRYLPYAFTEQGIAMLSSVLKSKKAIYMNISIMRAFVLLRQHLSDYRLLKQQIADLEMEMDRKFTDINEALKYLLEKKEDPTIGFKQKSDK